MQWQVCVPAAVLCRRAPAIPAGSPAVLALSGRLHTFRAVQCSHEGWPREAAFLTALVFEAQQTKSHSLLATIVLCGFPPSAKISLL